MLSMIMINYVLSMGPLSICLDATHWNIYISGKLTYSAKGNLINYVVDRENQVNITFFN